MTKNHFIICGASLDTGNLGVSALCNALVAAISKLDKDIQFTVLDYGKGIRRAKLFDGEKEIAVTLCGAIYNRRFYQKENLFNIQFCAATLKWLNPITKHLLTADAFLDVSGGDSFTDLYGKFRFNLVAATKKFAIRNKIPLILLPQTYGPFANEKRKDIAANLIKSAKLAWARDPRSFSILKELLGKRFDPELHKEGVDMAFLLPKLPCHSKINTKIKSWLDNAEKPVVGINISGLIYHNPEKARSHYGFKSDYKKTIQKVIEALLNLTKANIVLIPHVMSPEGHYESDDHANKKLLENLSTTDKARIEIQAPTLDPCEVKWLISQMNWFMGTRMHATIAALSTETPVCTISYSDKALGVFETCALGQHVFDPRQLNETQIIDSVINSYMRQEEIKGILQKNIPKVKNIGNQQMKDIDSF